MRLEEKFIDEGNETFKVGRIYINKCHIIYSKYNIEVQKPNIRHYFEKNKKENGHKLI